MSLITSLKEKANSIPPKSLLMPRANVMADLAVTITKQDREIAEQAITYNVIQFPCIKPIRGTLTFHIRNINRSTEEVIQALSLVESSNRKMVIKFVTLYRAADEISQKRHDILDIIANEVGISPISMMKWLLEGFILLGNVEVETILAEGRAPLLTKIRDMAQEDGGIRDRELLANIQGLVQKTGPAVVVNNNNNQQSINVGLPNFSSTAKEIEAAKVNPLQLSEGQHDYIDAEIIKEETRCPVEMER